MVDKLPSMIDSLQTPKLVYLSYQKMKVIDDLVVY